MPAIEQQIKQKIEAVGIPLKEWNVKIYRGILTGLNEAFIIDTPTKDKLIAADPKSAEIIRPILRGRDIKRYSYSFASLWLISTFPSRKYDIDDYPAVKDYLLSFGMERIEQTGKTYVIDGKEIKARKKTNNKWFETQDSIAYWDDFSKQKIVWGNLCLSAQYSLAEEGVVINAPATMIVPGDKFLLGALNSRIGDFFIRGLGVTRNGGYFEYKPMFIEQLPVPMLSDSERHPYIVLIDEILDLRKHGKDTTQKELELDRLFFSLYALNEQEICYLLNDRNF